ncbi:30S ribosomal protein S3 [Candidatus Nardonella dryophthoridicola]|uniref:Small ribosomal subunit protein uS3 n=1 Tax=endosymbiont of Rhynchophorus ferrugineus TaxID=1972133 RepID=A0A2Z5T3Y0_9GAMM|nr:30S ribosomal protein S3 [Candidatus Nardonella dryophthoridicola]BBA85097.1 30S ribosomal protein S3 [endosymbiont of Rhynchophorus ferrugineus]
MGQKVNPLGFRLGFIKKWNSLWFSNNKKKIIDNIEKDILLRSYLKNNLPNNYISNIIIEFLYMNIIINIVTSKPGIIIGKKGEDIDKLRIGIVKMLNNKYIKLNVIELKDYNLDSSIIANNISYQIERKISFRKIMKRYINNVMKYGALGVKIQVNGRLGGAEISRREWYKEGRIPLHTIRANIDFSQSIAKTNYGIIGIKVWIFKKNK